MGLLSATEGRIRRIRVHLVILDHPFTHLQELGRDGSRQRDHDAAELIVTSLSLSGLEELGCEHVTLSNRGTGA
jgi:poly-beta-hydroxyalkanoate depolymerase